MPGDESDVLFYVRSIQMVDELHMDNDVCHLYYFTANMSMEMKKVDEPETTSTEGLVCCYGNSPLRGSVVCRKFGRKVEALHARGSCEAAVHGDRHQEEHPCQIPPGDGLRDAEVALGAAPSGLHPKPREGDHAS